jgi:hypothetical protein
MAMTTNKNMRKLQTQILTNIKQASKQTKTADEKKKH